MIRTQIQLTERQANAVKRVATERGVSMAEVLRELVDAHLTEASGSDARARALRAIGRHRSGRADISGEHDREVATAFAR
jgi:predicted Ser/Thr protein kinase